MEGRREEPSQGIDFTDQDRAALLAAIGSIFTPLSPEDTEELVAELSHGDPQRAEAIRAFCNWGASELIVREAEEIFSGFVPPDQYWMLRIALKLLSSRVSGLAFAGRGVPFTELPAPQRLQILRGLATAPVRMLRRSGQVLRRVATLPMTTVTLEGGRSLLFDAIGYAGREGFRDGILAAEASKPDLLAGARLVLPPASDAAPLELLCDCVVVGSGVGGSVVAQAASRAGHKVLMLEKGPEQSASTLALTEPRCYMDLYERGGVLFMAENSPLTLAAGAALGGGSAVNWSCSLDPPHQVRQEWAAEYGLDWAANGALADALESVKRSLAVHCEVEHSPGNAVLLRGCDRLGYPAKVAPQQGYPTGVKVRDGLLGLGYKGGERQGMRGSLLQDAAATGCFQFLTGAFVDRVLVEGGRAVGVEGRAAGGRLLRVRSSVVACACGSLQTPLLLRRSGLRNQNIGENLRVHPVSSIFGVFDHPIKLWEGSPMTTVCTVAEDQDGKGYGVKVEVPPCHPLLLSANLPMGEDCKSIKRSLLRMDRTSILLAICRDSGSGSVESDKRLWPRVRYTLSKRDGQHLVTGLQYAARILVAAGAREIGWAHNDFARLPVGEQGVADPGFKAWLERLGRSGKPDQAGLLSAHQMGSCRMAASADRGALRPSGETWEVGGLFVCDTSTFPTASGSNPMMTCAAVAHLVAQEVLQQLKQPARSKL